MITFWHVTGLATPLSIYNHLKKGKFVGWSGCNLACTGSCIGKRKRLRCIQPSRIAMSFTHLFHLSSQFPCYFLSFSLSGSACPLCIQWFCGTVDKTLSHCSQHQSFSFFSDFFVSVLYLSFFSRLPSGPSPFLPSFLSLFFSPFCTPATVHYPHHALCFTYLSPLVSRLARARCPSKARENRGKWSVWWGEMRGSRYARENDRSIDDGNDIKRLKIERKSIEEFLS